MRFTFCATLCLAALLSLLAAVATADLSTVTDAHRAPAQRVVIGHSANGKPLRALRLGDSEAERKALIGEGVSAAQARLHARAAATVAGTGAGG